MAIGTCIWANTNDKKLLSAPIYISQGGAEENKEEEE
jgi:hypothetical protein